MTYKKSEVTEKKGSRPGFLFRLYITGASPNSSRAITNVKILFDNILEKNYELEIIDVYQNPGIAQLENIIALPLLVRKNPLPERRLIGDMSDSAKLVNLFGLENNE
jgi:circadian clock protein KaiB